MNKPSSSGLFLSSERTRWFDISCPVRPTSLLEAANFQLGASDATVQQLLQEAQGVYEEQEALWKASEYSRDARGTHVQTAKDRLAISVSMLSDGRCIPFVIQSGIRELCANLATKSTPHFSFVCRTIHELFTADYILPRTKTLRSFSQQALHAVPARTPSGARDRSLVLFLWFVEDRVKSAFGELLARLETEIRFSQVLLQRRMSALHLVGLLLYDIPEEQTRMCSLIVEKLGDPNTQLSGKCAATLIQYMQRRSGMQRNVVAELESLLFQPSTDLRTKTLAVHILNQVVYNHQDPKLAARCAKTYFSLFRHFITSGEIERRVVNGIMVGLKRAVPYVSSFTELEAHFETLFTMAGASGSFHHRIAALNLLQIVIEHNATSSSIAPIVPRFYRSLYHLISFDPVHVPQSSQLSLYFSLLYRVLRNVHDIALITSFVRRILQSAMTNSSAYACAALMLVGELRKANHALRSYLRSTQQQIRHATEKDASSGGSSPAPAASSSSQRRPTREDEGYDTSARDPKYARAHHECTWELRGLIQHFHPTVVKFSRLLLMGHEIDHGGHPLDDFSLVHFCELFSGKKANKRVREMQSIHQRKVDTSRANVVVPNAEALAQSAHDGGAWNVEGLFITKYEAQKKHSSSGMSKEALKAQRQEARQARQAAKKKRRKDKEEAIAKEALQLFQKEQAQACATAMDASEPKLKRRRMVSKQEEEDAQGEYPSDLKKYLKYSYEDLAKELIEVDDDVLTSSKVVMEDEERGITSEGSKGKKLSKKGKRA